MDHPSSSTKVFEGFVDRCRWAAPNGQQYDIVQQMLEDPHRHRVTFKLMGSDPDAVRFVTSLPGNQRIGKLESHEMRSLFLAAREASGHGVAAASGESGVEGSPRTQVPRLVERG